MVQVYRKQDLLNFGLTDHDLRHAEQCCLEKIRRGHYLLARPCETELHVALHRLPATEYGIYPESDGDIRDNSERLKAHIRSRVDELQPGDVFSHISAALIYGLDPPFPATEKAEIIRAGYHRNFSTLRIYERAASPAERTRIGDFPATTLQRTLSDIAHDYPLEISVPMISEALRTRHVDKRVLRESLTTCRRGCRRAQLSLELSDPSHESQGESLCAVKFHRFSIPGLAPQIDTYDANGNFLGRNDFRHKRLPVIVEFHGLNKYYLNEMGPDQASKQNHERHMKLINAGYTVFNLVWADLFRDEIFHTIKRHIAESAPPRRRRTS